MPRRNLIRSIVAAVFAAAVPGLRAELIKISPFMPPASSSAAPTQNAPLQYMGWVQTAGGILYRVVDPTHKTGVFLKIGEKDANLDVLVKQYDDDRGTLTIEHGGQTLTLAEHEAKVLSGGMVTQMVPPPMPMPGPGMSPGVTQSVVVNPTPADEQRRLEAVAAEVARRRALREQAAQQQQMQTGIQPVAPMPPQQTRQDLQQAQPGQYPQNANPQGRRQRATR
jgi:hypothetical protein